jgi:hypothetical protein
MLTKCHVVNKFYINKMTRTHPGHMDHFGIIQKWGKIESPQNPTLIDSFMIYWLIDSLLIDWFVVDWLIRCWLFVDVVLVTYSFMICHVWLYVKSFARGVIRLDMSCLIISLTFDVIYLFHYFLVRIQESSGKWNFPFSFILVKSSKHHKY